VLVPFAEAGATAAGLAAAVDVFGLNRSPRANLAGDAAGLAAAAAPAFVRATRLALGEAAGDAAGLAAAVASACLRARFALGEAAGEAADEGDAAVSASEAVVSAFFLWVRFVGSFADGSPGLGD
jgi:hypothetical protein